jgi:hypothetical protein
MYKGRTVVILLDGLGVTIICVEGAYNKMYKCINV